MKNLQTIKAGDELLELIQLTYEARQPLLAWGVHGIGKSSIFGQAAGALGVELLTRDLSLMEPVDLVGCPQFEEGTMRYAQPEYLPRDGDGLFLLEEANRCSELMQSCSLEFLTSRRLHLSDYDLPDGWVLCAAANPANSGYHVQELDPAFRDRFVEVHVVADPACWLAWARPEGLHPAVLTHVQDNPKIFDDAMSTPRAWHKVSEVLVAYEQGEHTSETLASAIAGLVGRQAAIAFAHSYAGGMRPLQPEEVLRTYPANRQRVQDWTRQRRLDLLLSTLEQLRKEIERRGGPSTLPQELREHLDLFVTDLPAEFRRKARDWSLGTEAAK